MTFRKFWMPAALTCTFLFIGKPLIAQGPGLSTSAGKQQGLNRGLENLYRVLEDKSKRNTSIVNLNNREIEGSPYYQEEFLPGAIYYNNEYMGEPYLRYDAYADEIQIKRTDMDEEQYGALLRSDKLYAVILGKKLEYRELRNATGEVTRGYVFSLVNGGKYKLYMRERKLFQQGRAAPTSLTMAVPAKYLDKLEYYMGKEGTDAGRLQELGTSKKDVLSLFDEEDQKALKSFIKKKRLNLKEQDDLRTLFYQANTL